MRYDGQPPPPEWLVYKLCRLLNCLPSEVEAQSMDAMRDFMDCLALDEGSRG